MRKGSNALLYIFSERLIKNILEMRRMILFVPICMTDPGTKQIHHYLGYSRRVIRKEEKDDGQVFIIAGC